MKWKIERIVEDLITQMERKNILESYKWEVKGLGADYEIANLLRDRLHSHLSYRPIITNFPYVLYQGWNNNFFIQRIEGGNWIITGVGVVDILNQAQNPYK